jgi:gamma-glutamyltranspeptidase/glutathione hydrolase
VAAGFVLAVTFPEAGNIGGGGFMTLSIQNQPYFLDYREKAPKLAHRDLYLDQQKKVIPYKSLVGYQASGVPGTVAGFWQVHHRFGRLAWKKLLQPAIKLAQQGFEVSPQLEQTRKWYQGWIEGKSSSPVNFSQYFGDLTAGQIKKQPQLAATLMRIAEQGKTGFYQGPTANALVEQMQANNGLISQQDLLNYKAVWRDPVQINWQGKTFISAPPPSSGGIAIAQLLKMHTQLSSEYQARLKLLTTDEQKLAFKTHFFAELEKRVYADRAHFLGDPDFVEIPVKQLISDAYLAKRSADVKLDSISDTPSIKPGKIESTDTTHFSIVDFEGNAVSNTYTLNMPFGSGVVIEKAGFLMNNEMDDFSTKPGVANLFGVVGAKANEIAPEKRMLSSMSPTILLEDDKVQAVLGTPGGSSIITSVFQTLINLEEGDSPQMAVDRTRVHHQLLPKDVIFYNPELPETTKDELELMGYQLKRNNYLGDVQLIVRDPQTDLLKSASDNRGRGESRVFEPRLQ